MNRFGVVLVFAVLVPVPPVLQGQNQAAASHHAAHKPQGFADYALGKINPNDTDYGEALDAARGATVAHTMDDLYFWSNVVALILLSGVTTAFLFHLRAADKKEITAATLIAQLWNGRVSDRIEIERRTDQYNSLVDEHNAVVERELMARSQPALSEDSDATDLKRSVENPIARQRPELSCSRREHNSSGFRSVQHTDICNGGTESTATNRSARAPDRGDEKHRAESQAATRRYFALWNRSANETRPAGIGGG